MTGIDKFVWLKSGDSNHWSHGTRVDVSWTYQTLGTDDGAYRANNVKVVVHPNPTVRVQAVDIHLLEKHPHTGQLCSDIRRRLTPNGSRFETVFDWNSFLHIPEQELHVALRPNLANEPEVRLKDPISRRFNFLLSFAA
ncbi:MAG: hypothetical protein ABI859_01295 [Pseudomonadota bacterium]